MPRLLRALVGVVLLLGTSVGCGSGTVANPGGDSTTAPAGAGISVDTARGPVRLPKPATRVVSLEWTYTEDLLALGVTPVGNADNAGYGTWVAADSAALPAGVTDVGKRQQPSIEQIRALAPDLIVAEDDRVQENLDQLKAIAPVVSFRYTAKPQLATMQRNFTELAKAVGRQDKATEVLGSLDAKAADLKARLERAGRSGTEYTLGQAPSGAPNIRMLTDDAFAPQALARAGLRNSWHGQGDAWGMTTVGVEGLTQIPPSATFLYVASKDNPFLGAVAANPVWQHLPFVQQDRALALDSGTWLFGGPLSAVKLLDEVGKALHV